jgi:hypothetical protein
VPGYTKAKKLYFNFQEEQHTNCHEGIIGCGNYFVGLYSIVEVDDEARKGIYLVRVLKFLTRGG